MANSALVIRHAESIWNEAGRWQGWADPPLTRRGRHDARRGVERFRTLGFEAVVSSDLSRALVTAGILAGGLGLAPPTPDARLRERDVGVWRGLSDEHIEQGWPGALDAWRNGRLAAAPSGETVVQVVARVRAALLEILERHQRVLVVSHSGALRAVERSLGLAGGEVTHLEGRWVHASEGALDAGAAVTALSSHRP